MTFKSFNHNASHHFDLPRQNTTSGVVHHLPQRLHSTWPDLPNLTDVNQTKKQYIDLFSTGQTTTHSRPAMLLPSGRNQQSAYRFANGARGSSVLSGLRRDGVHTSRGSRLSSDLSSVNAASSAISSNADFNCTNIMLHHPDLGVYCTSETGEVIKHKSGMISTHCDAHPDHVTHLDGVQTQSSIDTYPLIHDGSTTSSFTAIDCRSQRLNCSNENGSRTPVQTIPIPPTVPPMGIGSLGPLRTGHSSYPTLLQRHEPRRSATNTADTVDISSSQLFRPIDRLDAMTRNSYQRDVSVRPPFTYHSLIYMGMQSLKRQKVTLTDVSSWIKEHFAFYRETSIPWQDELQHNLTASRCFQRVPRRKEDPGGRGDLWRLCPELQTQLSKDQIGMKYLQFWQYDTRPKPLDHSSHNEVSSVVDSRMQKLTCIGQITTKCPTFAEISHFDNGIVIPYRESPSTFVETTPRWPSVVKRRRTAWSGESPPYSTNHSQIQSSSEEIQIQHDMTSCSTSSSSPPLSDICTPPLAPTAPLLYEPFRNSPDQLLTHDLLGTNIQADCCIDSSPHDLEIMIPEHPMEQRIGAPQELNKAVRSIDSSTIQTSLDPEHCHFELCGKTFVHLEDQKRQELIECDSETNSVDGLFNSYDLYDIPTLDLNPMANALDLTVRGISLKASTCDWWNPSSTESMDTFMDVKLSRSDPVSSEEEQEGRRDRLIDESSHNLSTPGVDIEDATLIPLTVSNMDGSELTISMGSNAFCPIQFGTNLLGTHSQFNVDSPLSFTEDQRWIDEQLNLAELDSILGLT